MNSPECAGTEAMQVTKSEPRRTLRTAAKPTATAASLTTESQPYPFGKSKAFIPNGDG